METVRLTRPERVDFRLVRGTGWGRAVAGHWQQAVADTFGAVQAEAERRVRQH